MQTEKTRIRFNYDGKDYTLEFTAASLKKMQAKGFNFVDFDSHALTVPEDVFSGAFIANHNDTPDKLRKEIFHDLAATEADGEALEEILVAMVEEAMEEITYHRGNTKWEVVR